MHNSHPAGLKIIRSRLGEDDVGVVSGMEKEIDSGSWISIDITGVNQIY